MIIIGRCLLHLLQQETFITLIQKNETINKTTEEKLKFYWSKFTKPVTWKGLGLGLG